MMIPPQRGIIVDCCACDCRPVLGAKALVQASAGLRRRVSAVRNLFGTMQQLARAPSHPRQR